MEKENYASDSVGAYIVGLTIDSDFMRRLGIGGIPYAITSMLSKEQRQMLNKGGVEANLLVILESEGFGAAQRSRVDFFLNSFENIKSMILELFDGALDYSNSLLTPYVKHMLYDIFASLYKENANKQLLIEKTMALATYLKVTALLLDSKTV